MKNQIKGRVMNGNSSISKEIRVKSTLVKYIYKDNKTKIKKIQTTFKKLGTY